MPETPTCSKCGTAEAGPGGILCPDCKAKISGAQGLPAPEGS